MSVLRYQCLFSPLEKLPAFEQLTEELTRGGTTALYGPDDSQKAHLLAAAQEKTELSSKLYQLPATKGALSISSIFLI